MSDDELRIPVLKIDDSDNFHHGTLQVQPMNDDISLSFFAKTSAKPSNFPALPKFFHFLTEFSFIEINSKDRFLFTFSGSHGKVRYQFSSDYDVSRFRSFVSKIVKFTPDPSNPQRENIERAGPTYSILDSPSNSSSALIIRPNLKKSMTDSLKSLSVSDFEQMFNLEGQLLPPPSSLYNVDIELPIMQELWPLLLKPKYANWSRADRRAKIDRIRNKYSLIKRQWQATSPRQWHNSQDLQRIVLSLETDLDSNFQAFRRFNDPPSVQQIAFNILLTVSFWNWDDASYSKDLYLLLIPFLESIIKQVNDKSIVTHRGDVFEIEFLEADVFWHFTTFYCSQKIVNFIRPSNNDRLRPLFASINKVLREQFQDFLQVFGPKISIVLDILQEDCRLWFANWFEGASLRRLWISIAGFANLDLFFQSFIIAILYAIAPEIDKIGDDGFVENFQNKKKGLDLGVLLINVKALAEMLQPT